MPTEWIYFEAISTIVLRELEYGVNHSQHIEKNLTALDAFLNAVQILSLEPEAREHYGRIHALLASETQLIGNNDMWIAAHARSLGLALITHNRSESSRVPDLVIDSWMDDQKSGVSSHIFNPRGSIRPVSAPSIATPARRP